MDGKEQKVGRRGCEGFRPIVGHREGKSQKCVFRFFPSRAHGGSLCAPLTSLAARKKSRFAEKKSALTKKNCGYGLLNCREWRSWQVGGMAVMEPLPRRDAPSCRGAIFCARIFNALSDSGIQHGGGIERRAQNMRLLILYPKCFTGFVGYLPFNWILLLISLTECWNFSVFF